MSTTAAARRPHAAALAAALAASLLAGCGDSTGSAGGPAAEVRIGYLPNLTHAPALIAVRRGLIARHLGPRTSLTTQIFTAGPACMTALLAGAIDLCFSGPSPAINAFVRSGGSAVRIVAGSVSGGAGLVVRGDGGIAGAADLRGRTLATPQLGNTQDVALRAYLAGHGMHTDAQGGGDVKIVPTDNATTLQLLAQHAIDGAWLPEPFLSRSLIEDGGRLLVDEATLWPQGHFVTTNLVAATTFLSDHPETVRAVIAATQEAVDSLSADPAAGRLAVNAELERLTTRRLPSRVLDAAWRRLQLTLDPLAASLRTSAERARTAGLLPGGADLDGIYDLRLLNGLLRDRGQPPVSTAGLGPG